MFNKTIYDIAKEAGVSVSTVSRVINNTAPVKDITRNKVLSYINKYQFQPNALARSLTKKETGMIGIILPDITNPFFPEVFAGAEEEARDKGFTFFLCNTAGNHGRESEYLSLLRDKQVDGIIFLGGRINLTRCSAELVKEITDLNHKIPIVLVNGNLSNASCYRVITDEFLGAKLATQHLIDLGHKDIGFLGGLDFMVPTVQKVKGFYQTMKDNGLEIRKEWTLHGEFSIPDGRRLMEQFLLMKSKPTAIFCVNDFTAIGAIKAVVEKGLRIPEDIAIIGFDDTPLASAIIPELTTVSQQSQELGRTAVEVLHKLINKEKVKKLTVIKPELIVRQSTVGKKV
ncbi:MAG TPA: LacI family DNA-binding transcriptional regulator [Bacilli bacterium]